MKEYFSFDDRLGIQLPDLTMELADYSIEMTGQRFYNYHWELICGSIPDRIADLENKSTLSKPIFRRK